VTLACRWQIFGLVRMSSVFLQSLATCSPDLRHTRPDYRLLGDETLLAIVDCNRTG